MINVLFCPARDAFLNHRLACGGGGKKGWFWIGLGRVGFEASGKQLLLEDPVTVAEGRGGERGKEEGREEGSEAGVGFEASGKQLLEERIWTAVGRRRWEWREMEGGGKVLREIQGWEQEIGLLVKENKGGGDRLAVTAIKRFWASAARLEVVEGTADSATPRQVIPQL